MNFEINGINFENKGSWLMLLSIEKNLKDNFKNPKISLTCRSFKDYNKIQKTIYYKTIIFQKHKFWLELNNFFTKKFRKKNKILLQKEIDCFIDASGYSYGDTWSYKLPNVLSNRIKKLKKNKTKIIFLPQSFGPFNNPRVYSSTKSMLNLADLIFVRDYPSKIYLDQMKLMQNFTLCPDFTVNIEPEKVLTNRQKILIIPNYMIIREKNPRTISRLYNFYDIIIKFFMKKNYEVEILNHEGKKDQDVCDILSRKYKLKVINILNPIEVKSYIGGAYIVVASRYHGIVNSLNLAIPTIGLGWSHKYKYLFKDYNYDFGFINIDFTEKKLIEKLSYLIIETNHEKVVKQLKKSKNENRKKVEKAWDKIFQLCHQ